MGDPLTVADAVVTHVSIGLDGTGRPVAAVRLSVGMAMRSVPVTANPHNLRAIMEACGVTRLRDCDAIEVSIIIKGGRVEGIGRPHSGKHTVWS